MRPVNRGRRPGPLELLWSAREVGKCFTENLKYEISQHNILLVLPYHKSRVRSPEKTFSQKKSHINIVGIEFMFTFLTFLTST